MLRVEKWMLYNLKDHLKKVDQVNYSLEDSSERAVSVNGDPLKLNTSQ